MKRKAPRARPARASRLFDLAARRIDQSLGRRMFNVSTVRTLNARECASAVRSNDDGCQHTLELTAVRP